MNSKTAEEIRSEIANLKGELAALAGEGLEVWNGLDGGVADTPEGGATLTVEWAISDRSYTAWYPTTEAAKAALLKVAADNHCVPSDDGFYVGLTAQGCHSSKAYVTRRQDPEAGLRSERHIPCCFCGKDTYGQHTQAYGSVETGRTAKSWDEQIGHDPDPELCPNHPLITGNPISFYA